GIVPASLARRRTDAHRQLVRDVLGEAEAARLEANGRSLAPEQIHAMLEEARSDELAEPTNNTQASSAVALEPVRLTRREREVVRLIARGLTNRQIAVELDIADRTVDTHVTNIFKKLGVSSRVKVAAWAVERGMTNQ
ncbi:MAG TPA: response regulator transcription factor, partial [Thermomicrobiales bacterium]|nr:response regulator transcription factor [Thermomicrobiales bacterium]